jgi:hypothetical protein
MKKPFLFLLVLCAGYAHAQVSDAWKTQIESTFQHVNRSFVTTGLLNDYGLYFTNLEKFNGIPSDTNYIDKGEWQQLYTTVYSCRFNATATLQEPASVFALIDSLAVLNTGTVLFAGLHFKYERFKPNAVPSLVYVLNNKIYDTPGRTTTPYEIQETFAVVPTLSSLVGATHTFLFRPELFYSNTGKTISTLQIDFGDDGGYRVVAINTPMSIVYTTEGIKTLRFKITYTDNTFKESRTKLKVTNIATGNPQARYGSTDTAKFHFPLSSFNKTPKPYKNKVAGAWVTVGYANPDKKMRRPLIVVEGFDTWKIKYPDDPKKNLSFERFISREYLMQEIKYTHGTTYYETLSDALDGEGFDIIFVDFDDGTDYIQRNAYLVENIIEWVNSVKEPYNGVMQKNVVMGASMGGLIARYALRDMELSNPVIEHDTRLYASFDSPHQGANFPLAFQALVTHLAGIGVSVGLLNVSVGVTLGGISPELGRNYKVLNSPAARQMLRYSISGAGQSIAIDNTRHEVFMNEYASMGYPELGGIRNIVLANGSECGETQGYAPYAEFVNYHGKFRTDLWAYLGSVVLFGADPSWFVLPALTSRTDLKAQFVLNALPNQTDQRIYKGHVYVKKSILWGAITKTVTIFDKSFYSQLSCLPLDNNGGGYQGLNQEDVPVPLINKKFSFIPTFSALDIGSGHEPIITADVSRPYSPAFPPPAPKNIEADNFFVNPTEGNISNEAHVQITLRNGRWLFQEIVGEPQVFSCSPLCVNTPIENVISGPSLVCNSTAQFTISNTAPQYQTTWQVVPGELFTSSSGLGQEVNLQVLNPGGVGGNAVIQFTLQSGCGQTNIEKSFNVGTPLVPTIAPPGPLYKEPNQIVQLIVPDVSDQIEWSFEGSSNNYTYTFSPSGLECNFIPTAAGTYRVKTRSTFGCGFSDYSTVEIICRYNRPDLTIENLYVSTSFGSISFYYDVVNLGVTTANSPTVSYFWSSNTTYEQGTDQLIGSITTGDIPPQGRVPISTTYQSNKSKTYALVFADPNNLILEQNENNNLFFRQAIIPTRSPSPPQTFSAYPIPFNQELKINFTTNDGEIANSKEVFIIDFLDNSTKFKRNTTEDSITINTGFLSSGKYVLVVNSSMGYESLLIIKE